MCELLGVSDAFLKGGKPEEISDICLFSQQEKNSAEKPDREYGKNIIYLFLASGGELKMMMGILLFEVGMQPLKLIGLGVRKD